MQEPKHALLEPWYLPMKSPSPALIIVPDRFLAHPESWIQPLPLDTLFPQAGPLEVELGSGDGSFLVEWARRHPDRNFLGVERLLGRIRKLDRKAQRAGLEGVRGLRIEASYCLEYLLPPGSVEVLHVYFPDPWPKRRHRKNRLVNEHFASIAHRALKAGGWLHLRTDNADYFSQMTAVFSAFSETFRPEETPEELRSVLTDFEREFLARGISTLRASFRRP